MASLNGVNYAKTIAVPAVKITPGEFNGRVKCIYETYTMSAVLAADDLILGPKLPVGAKVIDATVKIDKSMGTTGIIDLGHAASVDLDGNTIAADPNAFISAADAGGQAVFQRMNGEAGFARRFNQETQIYATCTELSVTTDNVIEFAVFYMID